MTKRLKKPVDTKSDKGYNKDDNLACHKKGVIDMEASYKPVSGSLQNDKGTWVVRARVYDRETETYKQKTKSTKLKVKDSTKRKAERMMKDILAQWEKESNEGIHKTEPLFEDYVRGFLEKRAVKVKANTLKSYRTYADTHILPVLGKMKVRQMRLKHLQMFYNQLLETVSVKSAHKIHVVLSGALEDAVRDEVIQVNFADYVEFPREEKYEGKAYTSEQVARLFRAAELEGEPILSVVILGACYGLRRSEIAGLRWCDVDLVEKTLMVRNTVTQNGALRIEAEETKTKKSNRKLDLLDVTVPYFEKLKDTQMRAGLELDKVCAWPDGRPLRPDYIYTKLQKLLKKYDLPHIRVHDLRHTAATLLSTKATPKQVQEFLGHEKIATTLDTYTHLLDEDRRETSKIMNGILETTVFCSEKCSEKSGEVAVQNEEMG